MSKKIQIHPPAETAPNAPSKYPPARRHGTRQDFRALVAILNRLNLEKPEAGDLQNLGKYLRLFPALYQTEGDIAAQAQQNIAARYADNPYTRESVILAAQDLRTQLTLPGDSPLIVLAVEQCVTTYLLHYHTHARYIRHGLTSFDNHWDIRLRESQKGFLRALETLAHLRQLALPVMQINIGANQTNIASPGVAEPPPLDTLSQIIEQPIQPDQPDTAA